MGSPKGFIQRERAETIYRPIEERIKDYKEVELTLPEEIITGEASRCMECGTPFCHSLGCPLGNLIPEWNDLVYKNKWYEAYLRLELTNNFPEITGRLCPALCETACTLSINRSPVFTRQIERAIAEKAFKEGWITPHPPIHESGKRIAIVGSGPSGLAAAQQLRRMGHRVVVFEKYPKPGGILRYGIPDFKLEKHILERRIKQLIDEGVEFETDVEAGYDVSARYLRKKFDALLIATGSREPRDLDIPGRNLRGIHFALEFLAANNLKVSGEVPQEEAPYIFSLPSAENKKVLVIGGGDTGSDCVGTSLRQGALHITQVEILPKPQEWNNPYNPQWPNWPKILRTSSSHREAEAVGKLTRLWGVMVKSFESLKTERATSDRVGRANFVRVEWKIDQNGRFYPKEIEGSAFSIEADIVLLAMGFLHVRHTTLLKDLKLNYDARGNIETNAYYMTSTPGVFATGDAKTGASLVVRAINHGRRAAEAINRFLYSQ